MADEDNDGMGALIAAFADTQVRALAMQFVLLEVVRELARSKEPNGRRYLADLFERAMGRLDQRTLEEQGKADAEMREALSKFFSQASHGLD